MARYLIGRIPRSFGQPCRRNRRQAQSTAVFASMGFIEYTYGEECIPTRQRMYHHVCGCPTGIIGPSKTSEELADSPAYTSKTRIYIDIHSHGHTERETSYMFLLLSLFVGSPYIDPCLLPVHRNTCQERCLFVSFHVNRVCTNDVRNPLLERVEEDVRLPF